MKKTRRGDDEDKGDGILKFHHTFGPGMNGRGQGVIVLPEGFPYCRLLNSHFLQMVLVFPLLKHPKKRIQPKISI